MDFTLLWCGDFCKSSPLRETLFVGIMWDELVLVRNGNTRDARDEELIKTDVEASISPVLT